MTIDVANGARSFAVSNKGTAALGGEDANNNGDHALRLRDANWWIQSERLGKVTVGRLSGSGPIPTIDLGGVSVVASSAPALIGGGLFLRDSVTGKLSGLTMANVTDYGGNQGIRQEGVKWTSPTWQGFVVSASTGEATKREIGNNVDGAFNGNVYGVDLKYANEFNGVRLAYGIGYEQFTDNDSSSPLHARVSQWGTALSLLHVATGLFVQGDYQNTRHAALVSPVAPAPNFFATDVEAKRWMIQAGLQRNWFGIGNTNLAVEYGKHDNWAGAAFNNSASLTPGNAAAAVVGVSGGNNAFFGLAAVQNIDAAAMELYLGWRRYSTSDAVISSQLAGAPSVPGPATIGALVNTPTSFKDLDVVTAGARIKF